MVSKIQVLLWRFGPELPFDRSTFSGGEEHVRLRPKENWRTNFDHFTIKAHLTDASSFSTLELVVDALRRL